MFADDNNKNKWNYKVNKPQSIIKNNNPELGKNPNVYSQNNTAIASFIALYL